MVVNLWECCLHSIMNSLCIFSPKVCAVLRIRAWSITRLLYHLFKIGRLLKCHCTFYIYEALGKKAFCWILKRWFISCITGKNVQKLQILLFFASYIAYILKVEGFLISSLSLWPTHTTLQNQVTENEHHFVILQRKWGQRNEVSFPVQNNHPIFTF